MPKFGSSTQTDASYQWKREHADKYQSWWGTVTTKESKITWSVKHARHPLIAWALSLQDLAAKQGTPAELLHAQEVVYELKNLPDFVGFRTWKINIEALGVHAEANISRIKGS